MTSSNVKKYQQLGEPHGTAVARLRKMILFDLLQKLDKNQCYRCGEKIDTIRELSIDHIQPWLDANDPKATFFDLGNISFSHLHCNCKCTKHVNTIPTAPDEGYCWRCKSVKKLDSFPLRWRRGKDACTQCNTDRTAERRVRLDRR